MVKKEELEAYWRGHVEAWQASGGTQRAYCGRHGLKCHSLSYWHRRQVRREGPPGGTALTLIPASILPEALESMASLSLNSPRGWRLEFSALPPAGWLVELWGDHP